MNQIKIIIYSLVIFIIFSSISIAIYYNNKYKNYQISLQNTTIKTQSENIVIHKQEQDKLNKNLETLNKTHVEEKKIIHKKFKDTENTNNKEIIYNDQFIQLLNEIEVISGNKNN